MLTSFYLHQCRDVRLGKHYPENANSISLIVERNYDEAGRFFVELSFFNLPPEVTDRMLAAFADTPEAADAATVIDMNGKVAQLVKAAQAVRAGGLGERELGRVLDDLDAALKRFPEFEPVTLPDISVPLFTAELSGEGPTATDINPPSPTVDDEQPF